MLTCVVALVQYFVMLLWGIGWVASNMTDHMQEKSKQEDICKHALSNEASTPLKGVTFHG